MLAKLLSLLVHAKAGMLSGVLLLGATGALVSVSTSNGVTTVTITQPSASPSTEVTTVTATRSPKPSESPKLSSSSTTSSACSDAAKAVSLQVQRVDTAFKGFHTDLMHLRGQRSVVVLETADVTLKHVRQAAVKALHATLATTCTKTDEDTDTDKAETDNDEDSSTAASGTTSLNTDREKDEDGDRAAKPATTPITFTGTDAKGIADQAIAMMQTAFDTAKAAAASPLKAARTPEPSRSPRVPQSSHKPEVRSHD